MLTRMYIPSKIVCNKRVICHNSKRVFELHSNISETKLELVRDAYEACHHLSVKHKEACYLVFGLNAKNVETYFPIVEDFEQNYHKKNIKYQDLYVYHLDPDKSSTILKIGPYKFTIEKHE